MAVRQVPIKVYQEGRESQLARRATRKVERTDVDERKPTMRNRGHFSSDLSSARNKVPKKIKTNVFPR